GRNAQCSGRATGALGTASPADWPAGSPSRDRKTTGRRGRFTAGLGVRVAGRRRRRGRGYLVEYILGAATGTKKKTRDAVMTVANPPSRERLVTPGVRLAWTCECARQGYVNDGSVHDRLSRG